METDLYEQLARYMNLKHPTVPYHFDLSGLWTPSHKLRNLYGHLNARAWPDLFIVQPMVYVEPDDPVITDRHQIACGLFIELKREGTKLYKKDGTLRANAHVYEQQAMLLMLRNQGYHAEFAVGLPEAIRIIEEYLG